MARKIDPNYDNRVGAEIEGQKTKEKSRIFEFLPWYLLLFFFLWLGFQVGTQHFASYYNYHKGLGAPLFGNFYNPLNFFIWLPQAYKYNSDIVIQSLVKASLFGFLPSFVVIVIINYKYRIKLKGSSQFLHGSAHWASLKEIVKASLLPEDYEDLDILEHAQMQHDCNVKKESIIYSGILTIFFHPILFFTLKSSSTKKNKAKSKQIKDRLEKSLIPGKAFATLHPKLFFKIEFLKNLRPKKENEGVFLGAVRDKKGNIHYLRDNGPTHIEVVAPTRSGKGVGLVNPTLLTWRHSCFVADLKGELWALTSGWRSRKSDNTPLSGADNICIKFEPAAYRKDLNAVYNDKNQIIGRRKTHLRYNQKGEVVGHISPNVQYDDDGEPIIDEKGKIQTTDGKLPEPEFKDDGEELTEEAWNCSRWNPLEEIRAEGSTEYYFDVKTRKIKTRISDGQSEIADAQIIANIIMDPNGTGDSDIWSKAAQGLVVPGIIHLIHNLPEMCNLRTLQLMFTGAVNTAKIREMRKEGTFVPDEDKLPKCENLKELWEDMMLGLDKDGKRYKYSVEVSSAGQNQYGLPDETAQSVVFNLTTAFPLYYNKNIAENTSKCDFRIGQLMDLEKPVSLYLVTSPKDKNYLMPLSRLFVNMLLRLLCTDLQFVKGQQLNPHKHRMLLMLDEFPSLGKLDILQESLAFMAGYMLKGYLITQDMAQLMDKYGDKEQISSNCHISAWYAPLKVETAEIMSKKSGTTTILEETASVSGEGLKQSRSRSIQATGRALLSPDECLTLPGAQKDRNGNILKAGAIVVYAAGFPPTRGEQSLYFLNPILSKRANCQTKDSTDLINNADVTLEKELKDKAKETLYKRESQEENEIEDPQTEFENELKNVSKIAQKEMDLEFGHSHEEINNDPLSIFAKENNLELSERKGKTKEVIQKQRELEEKKAKEEKEAKRQKKRSQKISDSALSTRLKESLHKVNILYVPQLSWLAPDNYRLPNGQSLNDIDLTKKTIKELETFITEKDIKLGSNSRVQIYADENQHLEKELKALGLDKRYLTILHSEKIKTIRGLIRLSLSQFFGIKGLGPKGREQILQKLNQFELTVNMKILKDE